MKTKEEKQMTHPRFVVCVEKKYQLFSRALQQTEAEIGRFDVMLTVLLLLF